MCVSKQKIQHTFYKRNLYFTSQRATIYNNVLSFDLHYKKWLALHGVGTVCDSILTVGSTAYSTCDSQGRQLALKCNYTQWRASWWLSGLKHTLYIWHRSFISHHQKSLSPTTFCSRDFLLTGEAVGWTPVFVTSCWAGRTVHSLWTQLSLYQMHVIP